MYSSKRPASSEASLYCDWTPRLLRFFQLIVGDQTTAERLTIEALVESADIGGAYLSIGMPAALVRCAVEKAGVAEPSAPPQDALERAIQSLPLSQRVVVVLFRGLGLPLEEVATVTAISVRQVRRLWADGLLAIHSSLATAAAHGSTTRQHPGEFQ